ncbi:sugar ABC transporter permease [Nocardiopsis coralliicola]
MKQRTDWRAALLLLPAVALFTVFVLVPLLAAVAISLVEWDGIAAPEWAGGANWVRAATDETTLQSLWLTLQVVALSWILQAPVSILLGTFLANRARYRAVLGVFFFIPLLLSAVAVGLIWQALLSPDGALNTLLESAGLGALARPWLGDPGTALYAVSAVIAWQFIPFHTLLFQAAVRQIPAALYEAARIDGAGPVRQFFSVTLPQLKYTAATSTILIVNGSITYFDVIFIMTGGGPENATRILPMHMYATAFQETRIGYGSAIAVLLVALGLVFSLALLRLSRFSRMESQAEGV